MQARDSFFLKTSLLRRCQTHREAEVAPGGSSDIVSSWFWEVGGCTFSIFLLFAKCVSPAGGRLIFDALGSSGRSEDIFLLPCLYFISVFTVVSWCRTFLTFFLFLFSAFVFDFFVIF